MSDNVSGIIWGAVCMFTWGVASAIILIAICRLSSKRNKQVEQERE